MINFYSLFTHCVIVEDTVLALGLPDKGGISSSKERGEKQT